MIEYIKRLFCSHDWEIIDNKVISIYDYYHTENSYPIAHQRVIIQRCKKCGKIEKEIIKY